MLDYHALAHDAPRIMGPLQRRGIAKTILEELMRHLQVRNQSIAAVEGLRHKLNVASQRVQQQVQAGKPDAVQAARGQLKDLKELIKSSEAQLQTFEAALQNLLLNLPNPPDASVPTGATAADNVVAHTWGTPPSWTFTPQPHWELLEKLQLASFTQAATLSGARFCVMLGAGARLERALAHFMLDMARQQGYEEVSPPLLVQREAMQAAGQYPKFVGEAFETCDTDLVLIPTAEVPLVAMHRQTIFEAAQLPRRYCALTPCFRREAGAAGRDTRGLMRLHQFYKVELVSFCIPENSAAEHEQLTGHAELVLQRLQLPYRKVSLCSGDLGFAAAKTYDLEVWLPAEQAYREISSCSNCSDFQARRAAIRYRPAAAPGSSSLPKPQLLHTLNGSALAVGRTLVALLENYQQADGSITIPEALIPYFGAPQISAPVT